MALQTYFAPPYFAILSYTIDIKKAICWAKKICNLTGEVYLIALNSILGPGKETIKYYRKNPFYVFPFYMVKVSTAPVLQVLFVLKLKISI